jgi:Tetratricopeptide repeat
MDRLESHPRNWPLESELDCTELTSMLATLFSYESLFGPNHPQTLQMTAEVGIALCRNGQLDFAQPLLERGVRDLERVLGRNHDLRLGILAALRDRFVQRSEYQNAAAAQQELLHCQSERFGIDHPETLATRAGLGTILFMATDAAEEI